MRAKHVTWLSVAVLVACGCGSTRPTNSTDASTTTEPAMSSATAHLTTVRRTSTTQTDTPVTARPKKRPAIPTDASTTPPVSVPPPNPTPAAEVSDAVREVHSHDFTPRDTDDFEYPDFTSGLHVIIGSATESADGYTQRAFFFVHDQYIGTDLADPSATIQIVWRDDTTIALGYTIYKPNDAMCCPLGGAITVRYHWTGTRLAALDPIPSSDIRR
jgi:LppP/LprE lipoprotein